MVACVRFILVLLAGVWVIAAPSMAGQAKHDKDTCVQFHTEQAKFIESGILADLARGADWGKANLSAERLREVELYITLDEQIKFACREATLTPEMEHVEEIAKRLELNPNADPFAPLPPPETKPADAPASEVGASDANPAAKASKKKPQPATQAKPKPPAAKAAKPTASRSPDDAYRGPPMAGNTPDPAEGTAR